MRIKRFLAPDMRTAFRLVREEQGPDAVILSNRSVAGGVEVVAATDYDDSLVQQALRSASLDTNDGALPATPPRVPGPAPRVPGPTMPADRISRPTTAATLTTVPAPPAAPLAWPDDPSLVEVRQELAAMRQTIEREMGRFADERLRGSPARAQALDSLRGYGCDEQLAHEVALRIPATTDPSRSRGMMLAHLGKLLPIADAEPLLDHGVIALVGPTGAGKTTTLAKLAARYATRHSARDVALVTTDSHRIGARDQLNTYGRLLGMPVFEADASVSLSSLLDRLKDYRLVLIDTAGYSQRDRALLGQLTWLRAADRVRSLLVLPANAQSSDLDEVVRRYHSVSPVGIVLTKLDETGHLGGVLSVAARHGLPLTYVTDGQRVPEDLHLADAARLVLRCEESRKAADKPLTPEDTHAVA